MNVKQLSRTSFSGRIWYINDHDSVRNHKDLSQVGATIMYNRGITNHNEIDIFLKSKLKNTIVDPYKLKDMQKATERICRAIEQKQKILVFGDYDVDGVTSTCIMVRFLRDLGCLCEYFLPNRFSCGYGFSSDSFDHINNDVDLIIVLDSGVNAVDAVEKARGLGIDIVICDHHLQTVDVLPNACAVVNPNRRDQDDMDGIHLKYLCAAGVTFMLIIAIRRYLKRRDIDIDKYISVVALGTLCDVMKLQGINRAVVKYTLDNPNYIPGLQAMLNCCGIENARNSDDFAFFVGPLINAAGRIKDPTIALDILLDDDYLSAVRKVTILQELNKTRKDIEKDVIKEAIAEIDTWDTDRRAICVHGDGWNEGVIGIVSGKLKEKYHKPSFVIAFNGDRGKGSARSVPGVNLELVFRNALAEGLLVKGGGHALAGGFEIERHKVGDFVSFLERECVYERDNRLNIDYVITPDSNFDKIIDDLRILEPFGNGFAKPIFMMKNVIITNTKLSNNEQHLTLYFRTAISNTTMRGMIFHIASKQQLIRGINDNRTAKFDLAGFLNHSEQFGTSIIIEDVKLWE